MVDDGYLIGYEDTNGDFVEVGRFNNQAEDTNQPVEIVHTGSGEKVELGPGGFNANNITANSVNTKQIGNGYYYAAAFSGSDPDARLDAALASAPSGTTIYLERDEYVSDRTLSKQYALVGTGHDFNSSTQITGTWTIDGGETHISKAHGNGNGSITVASGSGCTLILLRGFSVTFDSGTSGNVIDSTTGVTVTDNGTNTVGDIA